jgi:hypothetical protein
MKKTKMMLKAEERLGMSLEEIIPITFEKHGTFQESAKALKINPNTLWVWMLRLGLQVTKKTLVRQNLGGGI